MGILVCCIGARSWTKIVAWIQIILFTLGVLVVGIGLVAVLVAGADAVNQSAEEITYSHNILHKTSSSNNYWHRDLAFVSEYLKLVGILSICVALLILGVILAAFLIKGANESNSVYLKCWLLHAVICLAWLILAEFLSADSISIFVFRISVPCFLYGFAISVVVALLREIQKEQQGKGQGQNRNRNRSRNWNRNLRGKLFPRPKKATHSEPEPESVVTSTSIIDSTEAKNPSKV